MMSIVFDVPLEPKGKGRPRFSRHGKFTKVYTDQATLDYETAIQGCASKAMGTQKPLEAPVSVFLYIRLPVPQLDAMNGTVYLDDTQVVELNLKKVYSAVAGVDVAIMEAK